MKATAYISHDPRTMKRANPDLNITALREKIRANNYKADESDAARFLELTKHMARGAVLSVSKGDLLLGAVSLAYLRERLDLNGVARILEAMARYRDHGGPTIGS